MGLLHEAREWWNEQPLEYRRKKEKQWEERYRKRLEETRGDLTIEKKPTIVGFFL